MKMLVAAAILQLGFAFHPLMADAQVVKGEPSPALKTCITSNAAGVEQAIASLEEAVDFLVQKMCAAPLAEQSSAQQLEAQERMLASQRKRMAAMCDASSAAQPTTVIVEPENGYDYWSHMCDPEVQAADAEDSFTAVYALGMNIAGPTTSPEATTLASQLLLKLRIDRLNRKP
jgi:hypothetical protein